MASNINAASSPAPDAPALSLVRTTAISTRPAAASIRGVKVAATVPWRMNVPSWTLRTRSTDGLNVTVNVIVDSRETLLIEIGTTYGPPETRSSGEVVVTITWAASGVAGAGSAGGVAGADGSRGGVPVGGGVPAGG